MAAPLQPAAAEAGQIELTEQQALVAKQETALAHPRKQPRLHIQTSASRARARGLPQFWEKLVDQDSGKDYYFNHRTGESSWETPLHPEEIAAQLAARKAAQTPRVLLRKQHSARKRAISRAQKPKLAVTYESKEEEPPAQRKRGTTTVSVV